MKPSPWIIVLVSLTSFPTAGRADTSFYSLDRTTHPAPPDLVSFTSDLSDPTVEVIGESGGLGTVHSTVMDLSPEGRLFAAPHGGVIYEIDPVTGSVTGSVVLTGQPIVGLAVGDNGLLYAAVDGEELIYAVDFDAQTSQVLASKPGRLNGLDFDLDGSLIGIDINQTGQVFRVPLDGSPVQVIATVPIIPAGGYQTFSSQDDAFYFGTQELAPTGRQLWRLSWSGGLPVGVPEYVKSIGDGEYVGLAARSEPLFSMPMNPVPYDSGDPATHQPSGPEYTFSMGRFEVTVSQFMAFLNDAEANQGNERGANLAFRSGGDVGLPDESADNKFIFVMSHNSDEPGYGIAYNASGLVGSRYSFDPAYGQHPIVGVSWFGALKFCNWLTIDQGLALGERVYHEGPGEGDWYPVASGPGAWPLTGAARQALVDEYEGYRLPMDMNGSSTAGPYNEWYKAASWDGDAAVNHVYGFGRDVLTAADANSRDSGDPWELGKTPVGYYDGVNPGTSADENYYGIFDLSGNTMEWMQDCDVDGRRTQRSGTYLDSDPALQLRTDEPRNSWPRSSDKAQGFRVVRVPDSSPTLFLGDLNCDGLINNGDIDPFVLALTDTAAYVLIFPDCDPYLADCNDDGWINNADIDPFVELLTVIE